MLIEGPAGWGEFCPFPEYGDAEAAAWLAAAVEQAAVGWPAPVRAPSRSTSSCRRSARSRRTRSSPRSGCRTAKVKVADHPGSLPEDLARVEAVRDALGPGGAVRVDANGAWDVDTAVAAVRALDRAAGGLEYVEQPCRTVEELAAVRRRVDVRIAADESIRRADDPLRVALAGAADVAVLKCAPLGGVRRALRVAEAAGLPCVVSSALETGVGLAAGLALAGALPELNSRAGWGRRAARGDVVTHAAAPGRRPSPGAAHSADARPALLDAHARGHRAGALVAPPFARVAGAVASSRVEIRPVGTMVAWRPVRTGACSSSATPTSSGSATRNAAGWVGRLAERSTATACPSPSTTSASAATPATTSRAAGRPRWGPAGGGVGGPDGRRFGVNDTTRVGGPRVAPDRSEANLRAVLEQAAMARLPVLVVGPPPVADAEQNRRIAALDTQFGAVRGGGGRPVRSVYAALAADPRWTDEVERGDGSHPAAGYALLAELVVPAWRGPGSGRRG